MFFVAIILFSTAWAQDEKWEDPKLNTAKDARFMLPQEKAMIYELNRLRSDPPRYAKLFIAHRLAVANNILRTEGKGVAHYSIKTSYDNSEVSRIDTIWHWVNEEEVHALQTLYDTLMNLKPLPVLKPDEGIYKACIKHAKDQAPTGSVTHRGTDASWPWDRIGKYSPSMIDGNENLACCGGDKYAVRRIVLQLLIDEGITNYGHRYNMLEAKWAYAACYMTRPGMLNNVWWIQNFGRKK